MIQEQNVFEVSEHNFDTAVLARSHQVPVVADFWAPWCGPCRMLGPVLEKLAREANGAFVLAKVNSDENPGLAMRYGIQGIPAVKAFRDGNVVDEFMGALPEPAVRQFIRRIAPSPADRLVAEAAKLLADHRWTEAETIYRQADTDQPTVALGLAKALLGQGKVQPAQTLLDSINDGPELAATEKLRPLARLLASSASDHNDASQDELETLLERSRQLMTERDFSAAMDALLDVLQRDKNHRGGEVRKAMIGLFELLGDDDPLTRAYRNKLTFVLF